jgi:hypothetical protein
MKKRFKKVNIGKNDYDSGVHQGIFMTSFMFIMFIPLYIESVWWILMPICSSILLSLTGYLLRREIVYEEIK